MNCFGGVFPCEEKVVFTTMKSTADERNITIPFPLVTSMAKPNAGEGVGDVGELGLIQVLMKRE